MIAVELVISDHAAEASCLKAQGFQCFRSCQCSAFLRGVHEEKHNIALRAVRGVELNDAANACGDGVLFLKDKFGVLLLLLLVHIDIFSYAFQQSVSRQCDSRRYSVELVEKRRDNDPIHDATGHGNLLVTVYSIVGRQRFTRRIAVQELGGGSAEDMQVTFPQPRRFDAQLMYLLHWL